MSAINVNDLETMIQEWETELDMMGCNSSIDRFEAHLKKAPEGSPSKQILADYVFSLKIAEKRSQHVH